MQMYDALHLPWLLRSLGINLNATLPFGRAG